MPSQGVTKGAITWLTYLMRVIAFPSESPASMALSLPSSSPPPSEVESSSELTADVPFFLWCGAIVWTKCFTTRCNKCSMHLKAYIKSESLWQWSTHSMSYSCAVHPLFIEGLFWSMWRVVWLMATPSLVNHLTCSGDQQEFERAVKWSHLATQIIPIQHTA